MGISGYVIGFVAGFFIGAFIMYRGAQQESKESTPSASHNKPSEEIFPPFKWCCGELMIMISVNEKWEYWCRKCGNTSHVG